jgi:hypothetical protein
MKPVFVMFPSLSSSFQRVSEREEKTSVCLFVFFCIDRRAERKEIENNSYLKDLETSQQEGHPVSTFSGVQPACAGALL